MVVIEKDRLELVMYRRLQYASPLSRLAQADDKRRSCTLKVEVQKGYATHKDLFFEALSIFDDVIIELRFLDLISTTYIFKLEVLIFKFFLSNLLSGLFFFSDG